MTADERSRYQAICLRVDQLAAGKVRAGLADKKTALFVLHAFAQGIEVYDRQFAGQCVPKFTETADPQCEPGRRAP